MIKANAIIDGVLYQRARFNKYDKKTKEEFLKRYNIGIVVSLVDHDSDMPSMCTYIHSQQPDSKYLDFEKLEYIADVVTDSIVNSQGVALVHCNGGRNRSGLLSALIVLRLLGITGAEALEYVREKRPNAIATPAFEQYLRNR